MTPYADLVRLRVSARPGVYWDVHGIVRVCFLLYVDGELHAAFDARTMIPILDPPAAIPFNPSK